METNGFLIYNKDKLSIQGNKISGRILLSITHDSEDDCSFAIMDDMSVKSLVENILDEKDQAVNDWASPFHDEKRKPNTVSFKNNTLTIFDSSEVYDHVNPETGKTRKKNGVYHHCDFKTEYLDPFLDIVLSVRNRIQNDMSLKTKSDIKAWEKFSKETQYMTELFEKFRNIN